MLGNIKFIGELGKLGMLHEQILHRCIKQLLDKKKNTPVRDMGEDLECLCQIMRTVGPRLDTNKAKAWMDQYFYRMKGFMQNPELLSRVRFMLQDVVELRENGWKPRRVTEKGPRTIQQVRQEAARDYGMYFGNQGQQQRPGPGSPGWHPGMMNGFGGPPGANPGGFTDIFGMPTGGKGNPGPPNSTPTGFPFDNFTPSHPVNLQKQRNSSPNNQGFQYQEGDRGRGRDRFEGNDRDRKPRDWEQNRESRDWRPYNRSENNGYRQDENNQGYNKRNQNYGRGGENQQFNSKDENQHNRDNQFYGRDGPNNRGGARFQPQQRETAAMKDLPPRFRKQQQQQQSTSPLSQSPQDPAPVPRTLTPPTQTPTPEVMPTKQKKSGKDGEISLRPAMHFNSFKPAIPNFLPKSAQAPPPQPMSQQGPARPLGSAPMMMQKQTPINIKHSPEKPKSAKKSQASKEELQEIKESLLVGLLENTELDENLSSLKDIKASKKYCVDLVSSILTKAIDQDDETRERAGELISALRKEKIVSSENYIDAFCGLLNKLSTLSDTIPLVKSYTAKFAAQAIVNCVIALEELAEPLENGQHYPLFLLCLQQMLRIKDKEWVTKIFNESQVDLLRMLPECDQNKDRMMEILEDRGLSFLFPLLRLQTDLWKMLRASDDPSTMLDWIKDNVSEDLYGTSGFITNLVTVIVRYVTSQASLAEGVDQSVAPEKPIKDKEKQALFPFKASLQTFMEDRLNQQVMAIYALQVFCHNNDFPKGLLLRMFMYFYDMDICEEDAYMRWKEEVNDEYPGKGKALFQVNQWLTWLEHAEEESEEEDE